MSTIVQQFGQFLLSASALDGIMPRLRAFHSDTILALLSGLMARPLPMTSGLAMIIAPHQDDETLGCGGLIALKRQRGVAVQVVFLTDGGKSPLPADGSLQRADLPSARLAEARAAMRELGVPEDDLHFLGLPDGTLKQLNNESREGVVGRLSSLITAHQPRRVFVPHWDDGHGDHEAAFTFAVEAVKRSNMQIEILQYSIWGPWLHPLFRLSSLRDLRSAYRLSIGVVQGEKAAAIKAYSSQVATLPAGFLARFHRPYELFFPIKVVTARESGLMKTLKLLICLASCEWAVGSGVSLLLSMAFPNGGRLPS